jgi:N-acetyl-anhydromuramyl-L-alanine amidase AmpD
MAIDLSTVRVIDVTRDTEPAVYNDRPAGVQPSAIVLHHTGGVNSLWWLSHFHPNPVSTHRLFNKVGWIYKVVADDKRAWHAGDSEFAGRGDWNDFSLGYEIENRGDGADIYPLPQRISVAASIAYDTALYHIPDYWVRTHREIAPGRKVDPVGLDLDELWRMVFEIRRNWPYSHPLWYAWR